MIRPDFPQEGIIPMATGIPEEQDAYDGPSFLHE
jgi:hypothetical protein